VKALAVKKATTTVPLIMVAVGDPVGTGLVPSLARPGGNLTGLSSIAPDLEGKRLQLLREIVPALSHVAMFVNSLNPFHVSSMRQARAAAQAMGIKLQLHDIQKSEDLDDAFAAIRKERPDALLILAVADSDNAPCISRPSTGPPQSQASKARHGSGTRPTAGFPCSSVG
jgi:putative tryptophan/tyrosine transport system substrate-binding protein